MNSITTYSVIFNFPVLVIFLKKINGCSAGPNPGANPAIVELWGRLSPIVSIAALIVLAVNMPPQLPAPGQAFFSIAVSCSSSIIDSLA